MLLFKVCVPTPTVTGDGIDNDCDGKIDEELCHDNWRNTGGIFGSIRNVY